MISTLSSTDTYSWVFEFRLVFLFFYCSVWTISSSALWSRLHNTHFYWILKCRDCLASFIPFNLGMVSCLSLLPAREWRWCYWVYDFAWVRTGTSLNVSLSLSLCVCMCACLCVGGSACHYGHMNCLPSVCARVSLSICILPHSRSLLFGLHVCVCLSGMCKQLAHRHMHMYTCIDRQ